LPLKKLPVRFATALPYSGTVATPENVVRFARAAEDAGFDRVQMGEHLLYPRSIKTPYPYTANGEMPPTGSPVRLEIFTTFSYLAGLTTRLRFKSSVAILPLRSPVLTAKTIATLDFLSGGRVILEVGVGWMREEFDALRIPFERRGDILDEYLQVIRCLFAGGEKFEGEFLSIPETDFAPRPIQDPFPIHIGCGLGERALRRVAKYAAGWSPIGATLDEVRGALPRLTGYLEEFGRSRFDLEISIPAGGPRVQDLRAEELIEQLHLATELGATCLSVDFGIRNAAEIDGALEGLRWFASEVAPHVTA
jgi:probable F420-dependent oxidoreductase